MTETNSDIFMARLVAGAIGQDNLNALILSLPGEFFDLDADGKAQAWRAALKAANQGEQDITKLAGAVRHYLSP